MKPNRQNVAGEFTNGELPLSTTDYRDSLGHCSDNSWSELAMRLVINTIPVLPWSADASGSVDLVNQRWLEYTEFSLEEAIGASSKKAIHPNDLPGVKAAVIDSRNYIRALETEEQFRRSDGKCRCFLIRTAALCDGDEKIICWYAINTGVEDRKSAGDTFRLNERDLRVVIDTPPGMMCSMSHFGGAGFVNRPILDFLRVLSAIDLRDWVRLIHPNDHDQVVSAWRHPVTMSIPCETTLPLRVVRGYRWFTENSEVMYVVPS